MKRLSCASIALLAVLFACNRVEEPAAPEEAAAEVTAVQPQVQQVNMYLDEELADELEASLQAGTMTTKAEGFKSAMEQMDVVSLERLFPYAGEFEARTRAAGLHKWYKVSYKGSISATKAEATLAEIPGVETVERPRRIKQQATPFFNDPYYSQQWGYVNTGSIKGSVAGADVNALPVWNNLTTGDPNVVVAVVDAGVDFAHEDLAAHVDLANSYNFCDRSSSIEPGEHGTHVAGTIAAVNNNGIGVSGIAGGDAAAGKAGTTIISCQVFSSTGNGGHTEAIKWAADHGAVIANNSWGYDYFDDQGRYLEEEAKRDYEFFLQPNEGEYHHSLKDAIDYFNTYAGKDKNGKQVGPMAGGACLFSAGNDGTLYGVPACYEGAISVGAVGPDGRKSSYTCYGDWVDLAAPGGNSQRFGTEGTIVSTVPNNQYGYLQGTSMACPHASGVAALVVAASGGQGFTREMLVEKLTKGHSTRVDLSGEQLGVMVDAWNAINYGDPNPPAVVTTLTLTPQSNSITAKWKVTGYEGVPASGFLLRYSANKADLEASTPTEMKEDVYEAYYTLSSEKIGDAVSLTVTDLDFETVYYAKIYAYNGSLVYSDASAIAEAKTDINNPPVIKTDVDINNIRIKASETVSVFFTIEDPDGHDFTVEHTAGSEAEAWRANPDGSYTLQIVATKAAAGSYKSIVKVIDSYGASAQAQVNYTILENHAPELKKAFDNVILSHAGESISLNLSDYFADEDGDILTYAVTNTSEAAVHVTANSGKLSATAITNGLATVTITAKDPLGKSVGSEFKIAVRTSEVPVTASINASTNTVSITNSELQPVGMDVVVYSATGAKVSEETVSGSAFEPATIDLSGLAPGLYTLVITYNGTEYKQTVVKK